MSTNGANGNGSGSVLKWLLGIATVILGGVGIAGVIWGVGSVFHNTSALELQKASISGIEKRLNDLETEQRNIKRILQDRKTQ